MLFSVCITRNSETICTIDLKLHRFDAEGMKMRTSIFYIHPNQPNYDPNHLKRGHLTKRKVGVSVSCGHIFLVFYLFIFFSDVVMASHGGDETKTISYMSKFLKYAPERAGGGGRKEN